MCFLRERERGRLWQSLSSRSLSGMCVLQRMRGEFFRTLPPLSLVKAQPHPPTLLFMVLAISENHVGTSTAQQSGAFSVAELQQQQQQQQTRDLTVREQRVVTAANRQHDDRGS